MRKLEIEERIKKIVGIPKGFRVYSLVKEKIKDWEYYRVHAYKPGVGIKGFYVKKKHEREVLSLWQEFERLRREDEEILKKIEENPQLREVVKRLVIK